MTDTQQPKEKKPDPRHTPESKAATAKLKLCPFCGGEAEFFINKSKQIMLAHYPVSGVCCPARYEVYCDSFEQGIEWWNTRLDADVRNDVPVSAMISQTLEKLSELHEKDTKAAMAERLEPIPINFTQDEIYEIAGRDGFWKSSAKAAFEHYADILCAQGMSRSGATDFLSRVYHTSAQEYGA